MADEMDPARTCDRCGNPHPEGRAMDFRTMTAVGISCLTMEERGRLLAGQNPFGEEAAG